MGEGAHRREIVALEQRIAEDFIERAKGGAARLFDGAFAARQAKPFQMRDPLEGLTVAFGQTRAVGRAHHRRDAQKFAAPDRAVEPEPRAIPDNPQNWL